MDATAVNVMLTEFPTVDANATVAEAETYLELSKAGCVPVMNPDKTVFGVLTPLNLAHFHRRPLNNPRAFHAWEICDARPLVVNQFSSLSNVTDVVIELRSNYVLVVNDEGHLVGLILAESLLSHWWETASQTRRAAVHRV